MADNKVITLSSSRGHIRRVVVDDLGDVVRVCREEEYLASKKERREPVVVGFKKADIVKD